MRGIAGGRGRMRRPAMSMRWSAVLFFWALAAATACGPKESGRPAAAVPPAEEEGFSHRRHQQVTCTACHVPQGGALSAELARPGARAHAPCDESGCHREAFLAPPGELCDLCHDRVIPTRLGETTLRPYPPATGKRSLASEFSHALHLDFEKMEERVGFHVSCTDCHALGDEGLGRPGHAVCSRCHAPESMAESAPAMNRCRACHEERQSAPVRHRRLIVGDLRFSHAGHRFDRKGKLIRCAECHSQSAAAARSGEHPLPATAACVGCHDDRARTPREKRMSQCQTCHATRSAAIANLPPRSHLPVGERPIDHTQAFRRDHAAEARRPDAGCARCHTFMSGTRRDTCDECHQTMRPRDHVVTWREFDHGPEAAARSDRCQVCHAADFCVACHRQRPRSHLPYLDFVRSGHGLRARLNLRACFTCHLPRRDCMTFRCHPSEVP